jgi:hypothetical protein
MSVLLWLLTVVLVLTAFWAWRRGEKSAAYRCAVAAFCACLTAVGLFQLALFVVLAGVPVFIVRKNWTDASLSGAAFFAILLVSVFNNRQPQQIANSNAQLSVSRATPIMEMSVTPDPYADCLDDHMSKRHCLRVAENARYKLSGEDKSLGESTPEPTGTPEPTASPTPEPTSYAQYMHEQKAEFLQSVDESISGGMIAGNKYKYVGNNVDIHCIVLSIVDQSTFNAACGEDSDGDPAVIVVQYDDTSSLDKGQSVRILGTVEDPAEGVNGFGGETTFPTVRAQFME